MDTTKIHPKIAYGTVHGKADDFGSPLPVDVDGLLEYVKNLEEEKKELELFNEWGKTATLKWNEELIKNKKLKERSDDDIEDAFLAKYIVPNYFLPEHLGVKDEEVEAFKKYVLGWACMGECNDIMKDLLVNFRANEQCDC
jgi:hypothetical protein